jgi:hypothetical protein
MPSTCREAHASPHHEVCWTAVHARRQLALALAHPNPYLASQAMSALMHITDEDLLFPWHDPPAAPDAPDGRGARSGPYALVWRRM